jgi:dihydroxy-acid dehydratase
MPGGKYTAFDVHKVGGIPVILKALLDAGLLHGDCMTVTGKTHGENLKDVKVPGPEQDVLKPVSKPIRADRRPEVAARQPVARGRGHQGRRTEEAPAHAARALLRRRRGVYGGRAGAGNPKGDVVIIRYEGPKGGPGMREMLAVTAAIVGQATATTSA